MSFVIYPAIDLRHGKVVRLKEGDPLRMTAYSDDPVETANRWLDAGARWLHIVNLDGAFGETDAANQDALKALLDLDVCIQFGGGLRSLASIDVALSLGVRRVVLGTIAIEQPEIVAAALKRFGAHQVAVGIDARDRFVRSRGWKDNTGIPATDLAAQMRTLGVRTVIFTDVSRDGLASGLNIDATRELAERSGLDVIASGGVHSIRDVVAARDANLSGVIIGRALYDGMIDLNKAVREGRDVS